MTLLKKPFCKIYKYFTEVESSKSVKKYGIAAISDVNGSIPAPLKESKSNIKKMEISSTYSIITKGTIIDGSISSSSNIIIEGVIHGDVNSEGNLKIYGKMTGNISAETVQIKDAIIKGDIQVKEVIEIGTLSRVDGNINAKSANIDCEINGNIDIHEKLFIGNSAVIAGDISTSSLTVCENAIIGGKVTVVR